VELTHAGVCNGMLTDLTHILLIDFLGVVHVTIIACLSLNITDMALPDRSNSTDYQHPQETNLLNLHKAMEYNDLGQPVIRTAIAAVTINGRIGKHQQCSDPGHQQQCPI
jgi:hypothetical protein